MGVLPNDALTYLDVLSNSAPIYLGVLLNVAKTSLDVLQNTATIYLAALLNVAFFSQVYMKHETTNSSQRIHFLILLWTNKFPTQRGDKSDMV